ncbi:hypothetical protein OS493_036130 [Desmophyllum pertusum]|uniref:Uncharacterized protein n=1 Tax=Desmophyllum pertusum TaxID=174260 RepID=A0A9W9Y8Y7_9CNID|nr:hypothetical protein OS493_036130 [Desmophyllum pertusum]
MGTSKEAENLARAYKLYHILRRWPRDIMGSEGKNERGNGPEPDPEQEKIGGSALQKNNSDRSDARVKVWSRNTGKETEYQFSPEALTEWLCRNYQETNKSCYISKDNLFREAINYFKVPETTSNKRNY